MQEQVQRRPEKFPDYSLDDGQLYKHIGHPTDVRVSNPWKLCVPREQRQRVLEDCHDHPSAGHPEDAQEDRPALLLAWTSSGRGTYKVSQCKPAVKMLTRQPTEPFALVGADFVGPLPRTRRGNTMLLVFIDVFSKWVQLIPLKKATSAQLEFGFRERILSRFGAPRRLICDNGTQFTSRSFRAFCRNNGIQLEYTAPYSPQQNLTERANRTIKTMIAQYVNQDHRTWDQLLPEVSLAINTSTSDSTGFSPAYRVQGRELRLPGALFDAVASDLHDSPLDPTERAKRLQEAFRTALETNQIASQEQSRHYNLRRRATRLARPTAPHPERLPSPLTSGALRSPAAPPPERRLLRALRNPHSSGASQWATCAAYRERSQRPLTSGAIPEISSATPRALAQPAHLRSTPETARTTSSPAISSARPPSAHTRSTPKARFPALLAPPSSAIYSASYSTHRDEETIATLTVDPGSLAARDSLLRHHQPLVGRPSHSHLIIQQPRNARASEAQYQRNSHISIHLTPTQRPNSSGHPATTFTGSTDENGPGTESVGGRRTKTSSVSLQTDRGGELLRIRRRIHDPSHGGQVDFLPAPGARGTLCRIGRHVPGGSYTKGSDQPVHLTDARRRGHLSLRAARTCPQPHSPRSFGGGASFSMGKPTPCVSWNESRKALQHTAYVTATSHGPSLDYYRAAPKADTEPTRCTPSPGRLSGEISWSFSSLHGTTSARRMRGGPAISKASSLSSSMWVNATSHRFRNCSGPRPSTTSSTSSTRQWELHYEEQPSARPSPTTPFGTPNPVISNRMIGPSLWSLRRGNVVPAPLTADASRETAGVVAHSRSRRRPTQRSPPLDPPLRLTGGRIVATVTIEVQLFSATIDTGASRSFVSEALANRLDSGRNIKEVRTQISLADGSPKELTKALHAQVRLDQQHVRMTLLTRCEPPNVKLVL
ncbi:uncharacterized protein LOC123038064 [Drosophila rhopaloa]|uniref:Integrase catalytic domain-containing protein n=1 Tax=Drosophila rhopaloa TaxID=1041015 RepID=A0ABM5JF55_DRORH|nr:uncharacterized protein LOC123038064 [Drosophila rhopaloa]